MTAFLCSTELASSLMGVLKYTNLEVRKLKLGRSGGPPIYRTVCIDSICIYALYHVHHLPPAFNFNFHLRLQSSYSSSPVFQHNQLILKSFMILK